jgi:predicted nucleic acid-binding protein
VRTYVDADILIWHLRGEERAADLLEQLADEPGNEFWIGALQRIEVLFFARPVELAATRSLLSRFRTQAVTQEIVDRGAELYKRWHPSHGVAVNDAILAATVQETGGRLYTQNAKHYPMPTVAAMRGW